MREALKAQGGEIWAISTEPVAKLKAERKKSPELPCLLAADPQAEALRTLHLVHEFAGRTVAAPANILVDKQGYVRWTHYAQLVPDRPDPRKILEEVKKLEPEAPEAPEAPAP